jgi:hypothetical protein
MGELIAIEKDQLKNILDVIANRNIINSDEIEQVWVDGMEILNKKNILREITILNKIYSEYKRANSIYPFFNSLHEGYAILREEVEELWDEIKKKPSKISPNRINEEAIQVSAMAMKIIISHCQKINLLI